jgi:hypothetical protein
MTGAVKEFRRHEQLGVPVADAAARESLERLAATVETGTPLVCGTENVVYLNSLQVRSATRFVFCVASQFDLVRRMLADDPKFARGQKLEFA